MSCISNNFSSFFLNSGTSEFSKYLNNGEAKFSSIEDLQLLGTNGQQQQASQLDYAYEPPSASTVSAHANANLEYAPTPPNETLIMPPHQQQQQQQQQQHTQQTVAAPPQTQQHYMPSNRWPTAIGTPNGNVPPSTAQHFDGSFEFVKYLRHSADYAHSGVANVTASAQHLSAAPIELTNAANAVPDSATVPASVSRAHTPIAINNTSRASPGSSPTMSSCSSSSTSASNANPHPNANAKGGGLIDLDSSTSQKSRNTSRKVAALLSSVSRSAAQSAHTLDEIFEQDDNKDDCMELTQTSTVSASASASAAAAAASVLTTALTNGSNSNDGMAFPVNSLYASGSNSNASFTECSEFGGMLSLNSAAATAATAAGAAKPLACFVIKDNFEVHPSHKVEEGIFQHMNKLPPKKKENLKQLGVRFTGQMTLNDKTIIVDNFIRFCEEYDIKDHRPFLSLNQCGLNKPEQIKFARYLGQGLPTFTLFCIYSNFKNLFCEKRTETYTKDGYNLAYILDKTKTFLASTAAAPNNGSSSSGGNGGNGSPMPIKSKNVSSSKSNTETATTAETTAATATPEAAAAAATTTRTRTASPIQTPNKSRANNTPTMTTTSATATTSDFGEFVAVSRTMPGSNITVEQQQQQQHKRPTPTSTPTPTTNASSSSSSSASTSSISSSASGSRTPTATPPNAVRIGTPNHLQMRPHMTHSPQPPIHPSHSVHSHPNPHNHQHHHQGHHQHQHQHQHHPHTHTHQPQYQYYHQHHQQYLQQQQQQQQQQQHASMNSIHSTGHPAHYQLHSQYGQHPLHMQHLHQHQHPHQHQHQHQQHVTAMQGHPQIYPHAPHPHNHSLAQNSTLPPMQGAHLVGAHLQTPPPPPPPPTSQLSHQMALMRSHGPGYATSAARNAPSMGAAGLEKSSMVSAATATTTATSTTSTATAHASASASNESSDTAESAQTTAEGAAPKCDDKPAA